MPENHKAATKEVLNALFHRNVTRPHESSLHLKELGDYLRGAAGDRYVGSVASEGQRPAFTVPTSAMVRLGLPIRPPSTIHGLSQEESKEALLEGYDQAPVVFYHVRRRDISRLEVLKLVGNFMRQNGDPRPGDDVVIINVFDGDLPAWRCVGLAKLKSHKELSIPVAELFMAEPTSAMGLEFDAPGGTPQEWSVGFISRW